MKVGRRRRLNLLIAGSGEPTVIFAPGITWTTCAWSLVQHPIAMQTRTVAFDPAGLGFSDPARLPRTASGIVDDLEAALRVAGLPPPYVLVGWSAGGLYMRLFAFRRPQDVVGMVMVDSSSEHYRQRTIEAAGLHAFQAESRYLRKLPHLERLARSGELTPGAPEYEEFVWGELPSLTPAVNAERRAQLSRPGFWRTIHSEAKALTGASADQVTNARRSLGDIPIVVLTAGELQPVPGETSADAEARHERWRAMHAEIAALSTRGQQRIVSGAGHGIQLDRPEVVISAIGKVLALARGG